MIPESSRENHSSIDDDWYAQQPWLVGSNYVPKSAINELEMWQEDTFDPTQIDNSQLCTMRSSCWLASRGSPVGPS